MNIFDYIIKKLEKIRWSKSSNPCFIGYGWCELTEIVSNKETLKIGDIPNGFISFESSNNSSNYLDVLNCLENEHLEKEGVYSWNAKGEGGESPKC